MFLMIDCEDDKFYTTLLSSELAKVIKAIVEFKIQL
jgi:hypothetical protein